MNISYWKVVFRSIKGSIVRFVAILSIIALGVGFFSGLKVTMPSFMLTGDKYIRDHALFDYRLISTIGFTDEDIDKIKTTEGVRACEGAFFADTLASRFRAGNTQKDEIIDVVRFHTITEGVNILELEEGRLPSAPDEVVIDAYACDSSFIGDKLVVEGSDGFAYDEYKIVGRVRTPYYLNFQKGTTDVGGGSINYFVFVQKDGMDFEYYTEAFVKLNSDLETYSDKYEDNVDAFEDTIKSKTEDVINARFDDLVNDAKKDYEDGLKEYNDTLDDAWEEIDKAQKDIDEARDTLKDAKTQIEDGETELADASEKLESSDEQLDAAKLELEANGLKIEEAQETFDEKKKELDDANTKLDEVRPLLPDLYAARDQLSASLTEMEDQRAVLVENEEAYRLGLEAGAPDLTEEGLQQIVDAVTLIDTNYPDVKAQYDEVVANITSIEEAETAYQEGLAAYDEAYEEFLAQKAQYESYVDDYNEGRSQLSKGLQDYEEGTEELENAKKEYEDGLTDFHDGQFELDYAKSDLAVNAASASRLLGHYKVQIESLEDPEVYVLKRDTNVGYVCFENDAKIVDGMAEVFPLFFFAIAALVCSTTMQRMVADERVQIGTMRSLGYTKTAIVMKYVIYSGLAAVIGCVGGFMGGTRLFPYVIWKVYEMMYGFAPITFKIDYLILAISLFVSLLCSVGVTIVTCIGEFTEEPAELVRPKAPQSGKRILLERIEPLWKRLKFLHKVSARNVFRFKKRMWMMIVGIAGCTALVITGFGLKDSIDNLINFQYDEIMTYDVSVTFDDDVKVSEMNELFNDANKSLGVNAEQVLVNNTNIKHNSKEAIRNVELISTSDPSLTNFIRPHFEGKNYELPSNGCVGITSKLADSNKLKVGDDITFEYGDEGKTFTLKIEYIFENYVYHYAIINSETYADVFEEEYKVNTAFYRVPDDKSYEYGSFIGKNDISKAWNVTAESRKTFGETMEQLNYVVILVIGCAALLAFIVLFNLNNINITERIREIATLKVLGFNRRETGGYVFRENFILVFLGFVVGIPLGILLHSFVISQIKMDLVTYKVLILPQSYVFSLLTVFLFSIIVDLVMLRKIDRIDMAESLKSIE